MRRRIDSTRATIDWGHCCSAAQLHLPPAAFALKGAGWGILAYIVIDQRVQDATQDGRRCHGCQRE